jgi:hypothetical protein
MTFWEALEYACEGALTRLPTLAVWAVGALICVLRWKKHPRVSLVALSAIALLFFSFLYDVAITVHMNFYRGWWSNPSHTKQFDFWNPLVWATVHALAWALILVAIIGWRSTGEVHRTTGAESEHASREASANDG